MRLLKMHSQSACFSFWSLGFGSLSEEGRGKSGMRASERKEPTVLQFAFSLPFFFSGEGPWLTHPASMTPNSGMRGGVGLHGSREWAPLGASSWLDLAASTGRLVPVPPAGNMITITTIPVMTYGEHWILTIPVMTYGEHWILRPGRMNDPWDIFVK